MKHITTLEEIITILNEKNIKIWKMTAPIQVIDGSVRTAKIKLISERHPIVEFGCSNIAIFKFENCKLIDPTTFSPVYCVIIRYAEW